MTHAPTELTVDWTTIDAVLLDMDGTLIDLHFDNTLWNSHLPEVYAKAQGLSIESARDVLFSHMRTHAQTIKFYCTDFWAEFTDLDIMGLHGDLAELVRYRQGTERFLQWLTTHSCKTLMATNAHRDSLEFKNSRLNLLTYFDTVVSSHDYQRVKEDQAFWEQLCEREHIDPSRALFIDDNEHVLDAAAEFGIREVFCVASPDSRREPRSQSAHRMIHDLNELVQQ